MRRFTEETAPNIKNRSHAITADVDVPDAQNQGVIIAQGGRFGGWSLYCLDGRICHDYNYFNLAHYTVRAAQPLAAGRHEIRVDFDYDGGGNGLGGTVLLIIDGTKFAEGRVEQTIPYYFSFDETLDIGVDLGTPVTDDYPVLDNAFTGTVHTVRIDLGSPTLSQDPTANEARHRRILTSQ